MSLLNANRICGRRFAGPSVSRATLNKNDGVEILFNEGSFKESTSGKRMASPVSGGIDYMVGFTDASCVIEGSSGAAKSHSAFTEIEHILTEHEEGCGHRVPYFAFADTNCVVDASPRLVSPMIAFTDTNYVVDAGPRTVSPVVAFTDTNCIVDTRPRMVSPYTVSVDNENVLASSMKNTSHAVGIGTDCIINTVPAGPDKGSSARYTSSVLVGTDRIIEDVGCTNYLSSVSVGTDGILEENLNDATCLSEVLVGTDGILEKETLYEHSVFVGTDGIVEDSKNVPCQHSNIGRTDDVAYTAVVDEGGDLVEKDANKEVVDVKAGDDAAKIAGKGALPRKGKDNIEGNPVNRKCAVTSPIHGDGKISKIYASDKSTVQGRKTCGPEAAMHAKS